MNCAEKTASVLLCLGFLLVAPRAQAGEYHLKLVATPHPEEVISELKWDESKDTQEPLLQIREPKKDLPTQFVKLRGSFLEKDRTLLFENQPVRLAPDRKFTIEVGIEGDHQEFTISQIDEAGNITLQKSEVLFPEWEQFKSPTKESLPKKWSITPGVGITLATYQQTGTASFTETALTVKLAADYAIAGPWDIGGSADYTMLPITTSQTGITLQFLGLNMRTGFRLLKPESEWGLSIMGGVYYVTTFASRGFGYHDLQGPQIYPVLRKKFSETKSAWFYVKYSPIFEGTDFVSFTNAEFALGGGYSFLNFPLPLLKIPGALAVTVDVALLTIQVTGGINVQSNTYTLGISYRF